MQIERGGQVSLSTPPPPLKEVSDMDVCAADYLVV